MYFHVNFWCFPSLFSLNSVNWTRRILFFISYLYKMYETSALIHLFTDILLISSPLYIKFEELLTKDPDVNELGSTMALASLNFLQD